MKLRRYKYLKLLLLLILLLISIYAGLFIGFKENINSGLLKFFDMTNIINPQILKIIRIPRVTKAIIAGTNLALAGMFIQSVSKNPLAEPYITGISSGAGLGIILSIIFLGGTGYAFCGFIGAILTAVVVIAVAGIHKFSITKLILVGLSINVFVGALISFLMLLNPDKSYIMMLLLSGGITNDDTISVSLLVLLFAFALIVCIFCIPLLNYLRLDENMIFQNRTRKRVYNSIILLISSALTSLSVFSAGIIGFVGIIAPQISRILFGEDFRWLFFSNIMLGALIILIADFLSRVLIYPLQLPLGLVVSLIGAPVFIYFLIRKEKIFND